jgi:hypothetical protein
MIKIVCPILDSLHSHLQSLQQNYPESLSVKESNSLLKNQCKNLLNMSI